METEENRWSFEEFGGATLGDPRRTRRLLQVASAAAARPGGTVTKVIFDPAAREGAFRWLENAQVSVDEVAASAHRSAAGRCAAHAHVVVAVDQATLSITDRGGHKGFGSSGDGTSRLSRGLEVMSALALSPSGTPLGLTAQQWWRRSKSVRGSSGPRPPEARESDLWRRTLQSSADTLSSHAPGTRPWFQLDRGGDFWRVFALTAQSDFWITVRAAYNRKLIEQDRSLSSALAEVAPSARFHLELPARADPTTFRRRAGRRATLELRYAQVDVRLKDHAGRIHPMPLTVVEVKEVGRSSATIQPLHWRLLTNRPVHTVDDARAVVDAYKMRWRIEDFHRTWKSGACDIEKSQLRSPDAFMRWATILASVAVRIERLKHLARNQPELPATTELTREEVDAAIIVSKTKKWKVGDDLTIVQAVELVAMIGGYIGKSSGGPPGAIVIKRGLRDIEAAATTITYFRTSD